MSARISKDVLQCVTNKVTPISYQINLEPSIGNHDEAFLKIYYNMLEGFSRDAMKYTAEYCQERIEVFEAEQETATKAPSENNTGEVFTEIKRTLKELNERKFIQLKYHSKTSAQGRQENKENKTLTPIRTVHLMLRLSKRNS